MRPLQVHSVPIAQQVPTVPFQAGTIPGTTTAPAQIDISSIMNMMIMLVVVVMMMKMMTSVTEKAGM